MHQTDMRKSEVELDISGSSKISRFIEQESHSWFVTEDFPTLFQHGCRNVDSHHAIRMTQPDSREPPHAAAEVQDGPETIGGAGAVFQQLTIDGDILFGKEGDAYHVLTCIILVEPA